MIILILIIIGKKIIFLNLDSILINDSKCFISVILKVIKLLKSKEASNVVDIKSWAPTLDTDELPRRKLPGKDETMTNFFHEKSSFLRVKNL